MMPLFIQLIIICLTTTYHIWATWRENKQIKPIGESIDIDGYSLHLYGKGSSKPTVIIEHSLGGIDGYFLIEKLAKISQVYSYDRAGYGWSQSSLNRRSSQEIVAELDKLITKAKIEPPYILIGESFGSYNARLYAHLFPNKVKGLILVDGLHEAEMLNLPLSIKVMKLFFISGFIMSFFGSACGIIRVIGNLKIFELIKPELRQVSPEMLASVKRSFYRPQHWITMIREMINLETSAEQLKTANNLGDLPTAIVQAESFFKPSMFNFFLPLKKVNALRHRIDDRLQKLSTNTISIKADRSSHFVWLDRPDTIVAAVELLLKQDKK
jgi:pimeloyl-ACP methyl ester carboxylesterase